ncbi:MAG: NifB/NifX family molybdenum-iron cluster-binding protein [Myxococcales bacterium]|jgi:predicted Fe-Mo cluster-binding NifX family protein
MAKVVAVACEDDQGLGAQVSMHFGRCPFFTLAQVDEGKVLSARVEKNPHFGNHQPGQMPVFIQSLGANVILAGGMGPKAVQMFEQMGIEVATGAVGRAEKVLQAWLEGRIKGITPCNHDHPESCGGHH